jgi:hypothetical protein
MATRSDLSGGISLRFTAAMELARELADRPYASGRPAPLPHPKRRVRVVGDPQTSLDRFLAVLDAHHLLGVDGYLADDVQLVSTGDHFDYEVHDETDPRVDGLAILRWLAEHAPNQVVILLGNCDAARIDGDDEAQRKLVIGLLRAGRFRLGTAAILADDRPALITHAALTSGEIEQLGVAADPRALATALDRRLADAVGARRDDWAKGQHTPLGLGDLLDHRYRPQDLPRGLVQVCGHVASDGARAVHPGQLSTLVVDGDKVVHDDGIAGVGGAVAVLHLVDAGINEPTLDPDHVPLLEITALQS